MQIDDFDIDEWESHRAAKAWWLGAASLLTLLVFLPLGAALGWSRFFSGPRLHTTGLWATLAGLPLFWLGVHGVLLSPLVKSGFLKPGEKPERLLAAFVLCCLPLVSFSYWLGDFRNSLHAYDLAVFAFAALAIPLAIFWRTGSAAALSVGVALTAFIPLFVVEDILGPFSPLFVYASQQPALYSLRTLCVAAALGVATLTPVPVLGRVKRDPAFRAAVVLFISISLLINATQIYLDWGTSVISLDLNFVAYLALLYFFNRTDAFGKKVFLALGFLQCASLLWQLGYCLSLEDAGVWVQAQILFAATGLLAVGTQLQRRLQQSSKSYFGRRTGSRRKRSPANLHSARPVES